MLYTKVPWTSRKKMHGIQWILRKEVEKGAIIAILTNKGKIRRIETVGNP